MLRRDAGVPWVASGEAPRLLAHLRQVAGSFLDAPSPINGGPAPVVIGDAAVGFSVLDGRALQPIVVAWPFCYAWVRSRGRNSKGGHIHLLGCHEAMGFQLL